MSSARNAMPIRGLGAEPQRVQEHSPYGGVKGGALLYKREAES